MDKKILVLSLAVLLVMVSLSAADVPISVYDGQGRLISQDYGDGVIPNYNFEILPSQEGSLLPDDSNSGDQYPQPGTF